MQQAQDFLDESEALHAILAGLDEAEFDQESAFKGWTINQILRHLHVWNIAADLSLTDQAAFPALVATLFSGGRSEPMPQAEAAYLNGLSGPALLTAWIGGAQATAAHFASADPKARLKWVGPDMSAISSISARLMESWAHGQAVYDMLGLDRADTDRIGNIARLGVNTFGWNYQTRKMSVPDTRPYVRLIAPSGAVWEYGPPDDIERIEGSATEFCQVVTQTRNIADTALRVTGAVATEWMAMAQCFAGPPNDPPAPGTRVKRRA